MVRRSAVAVALAALEGCAAGASAERMLKAGSGPTPAPTKEPAYSCQVTRTDKMAYTLSMVSNTGQPIQYGTVDVSNALVSKASDAASTTVTDSYELTAGCYYLETYSTAVDTTYARPELWTWTVASNAQASAAAGYGFDGQIFGVGGELCGIPDCYDSCRTDNQFANDWSQTDVCNNYGVLLKNCKCAAPNDQTQIAQMLLDAGCTVPAPWVVSDNLGVPIKNVTIVAKTHSQYNTTISLLLSGASVPDTNIPGSFESQVEGNALATFLGVYPWTKVTLETVNGKAAADVVTARRLREEDNAAQQQTRRRLAGRSLLRLYFGVDAQTPAAADQAARYAFLEQKPNDDFTALNNQLRSNVNLLKSSTLMSTEGYSKTRAVVDSVEFDVEYLGPTPEPTPSPTPAGGVDDDDPRKNQPTLKTVTQPPVSTSGSKSGGSGMGMYIGLAVGGLVGLGALYCLVGGALRNKKNAASNADAAASRRAADDEAFRRMQAANAAKLAAANGSVSAVPLD